MNSRAAIYVTYAQRSLLIFVLVCISIWPGLVLKRDEGGFSNYGIHIKTAVVYTFAYVVCALFTFMAARAVPRTSATLATLARILNAYGVLLLLILFSTYGYSLNTALKDIHAVISLLAMVFDPAVCVWLVVRMRRTHWDRFFFCLEFLGLVIGVIDFLKVAHVLFASEATLAFAFGFLIVRGVHSLTTAPSSVPT
jgi:hypothetical protein